VPAVAGCTRLAATWAGGRGGHDGPM
jgi:hypothetical protein